MVGGVVVEERDVYLFLVFAGDWYAERVVVSAFFFLACLRADKRRRGGKHSEKEGAKDGAGSPSSQCKTEIALEDRIETDVGALFGNDVESPELDEGIFALSSQGEWTRPRAKSRGSEQAAYR